MKLRLSFRLSFQPFLVALFLAIGSAGHSADLTGVPVLELSLKRVPAPEPANLADFIVDRPAAIALGKALFWDMRVGSDNVTACATCHNHAGSDSRSRNQLSPSLLRLAADGTPNPDTFVKLGMNYQLKMEDFPFHRKFNPADPLSRVVSDREDIVGSQGIVDSRYLGLAPNGTTLVENNLTVVDRIFNVNGVNTRRVAPRSTPSVINAVYNLRNFWDGRAQDIFNGVNPFGLRDTRAGVWYAKSTSTVEKVPVRLDRASLASQAVGPVLSSFEMSAAGRMFPELGKRLLPLRPLAGQVVHAQDSVLGTLRDTVSGLKGITYADLVRRAFRREWWSSMVLIRDDANGQTFLRKAATTNGLTNLYDPDADTLSTITTGEYSQIEANFSLFFGLALQLYQATLVSNDAPIDRFAEGNLTALTEAQQRGLGLFYNKALCAACHTGATFTSASLLEPGEGRVEVMVLGPNLTGLYDTGFYNVGVRPIAEDLGMGARDPFGNFLSDALIIKTGGMELLRTLTGTTQILFPFPGDVPIANGVFKTPGLRNVDLTAPYFHNGGQATLEQVVDFYNRGGDFNEFGKHEAVRPLFLTIQEKSDLVAFLKSLTDERVRYERAPFDHPQLFVPNGHQAATKTGGVIPVTTDALRAKDVMVEIPAVGAAGVNIPRKSFLQ